MTRKARVAGFAVMASIFLAACTGSGPLVATLDGTGSFCGPGDRNSEIFFANDFLENTSKSPVEVISVTPNNGDNLLVRDFSVGYSERGDQLGSAAPDRSTLTGGHIFYPKEIGFIQLILKLDDPSREGSATSLEVRYRDQTRMWERSVSTVFELRVAPYGYGCNEHGEIAPIDMNPPIDES